MDVKIALAPVTSADRFDKVKSGAADLECGSTTSNLQRQKDVAFSPVFFVAGTKLMVPKASSIASYRDLAGKTAVVTAGTTNEARDAHAVRQAKPQHQHRHGAGSCRVFRDAGLRQGQRLRHRRRSALRHGRDRAPRTTIKVVGEYLSYDPYGLCIAGTIPGSPRSSNRPSRGWRNAAARPNSTTNGSCTACRPVETLNLPMSPQLQEIFQVLGQPE